MIKFDRKKIYKFGILKGLSEIQPNFPEFSSSYPILSIPGDRLISNGIPNFDVYLNKNPHNYPTKKTIHCYTIDEEGNYSHFAEGNPFDVKPTEQSLSDDPKTNKFAGQAHTTPKADSGETIKEYKTLLKKQEDISDDLRKNIDNRIDEIAALKDKILKQDGEKIRWKYEKEEFERVIDGLNKKFEEGASGSGLADKLKASLADRGGEILSNITANPQLADLIVNFASKIPYFKNMMSTAPPNPTMADNLNNDGESAREDEFDENS